jgi:hypothetical protein
MQQIIQRKIASGELVERTDDRGLKYLEQVKVWNNNDFEYICRKLTVLMYERLGDLTIKEEIDIGIIVKNYMSNHHIFDYTNFDFEKTINDMFENCEFKDILKIIQFRKIRNHYE